MPSGEVHDKTTIAGAALAAPACFYLTPSLSHDPTVVAALVGAVLFSGLMLSPDLDLNSAPYHRWGLFRHLWWPYQKILRHRSPLSHSYLVGPTLRIAYFLFVVWAAFRAATWALTYVVAFDRNTLSVRYTDSFLAFWQAHPRHLAAVAARLFLGTALHVTADLVVTGFKRRL
jgi:uncharacterized metal-binding protein